MITYADLRWEIIEKWNSDAKYTNEYLINIATDLGVEIRNIRADRKSIVAKTVDGVINSGVDSGEYNVTSWGTGSENDTHFQNFKFIKVIQIICLILFLRNIS